MTEPKVLTAMGEDTHQRMMKMAGDTLISSESDIYALNPKISNVSADFAAADPEFWTPQPTVMASQKAGKTSNNMVPREKKDGK